MPRAVQYFTMYTQVTSSTESPVKVLKIKIFLKKQVICYTNSLLHYLHEFVGTIDTVLSLRHTVEPLLSSHPLGNGRIGALRIFFTIKLSPSNYGKRITINMYLNVFIRHPFLSQNFICYCLFSNEANYAYYISVDG